MKANFYLFIISIIFLLYLNARAQELSYIIIRDAPDGEGNEVTNISMTADQDINLYAAGYDESDNYVYDLTAKWSTTGTLDRIEDDSTDIFIFSPSTAPTSGSIIATFDDLSDATGIITVIPGALCAVRFFSEYPDTMFVSVSQTIILHIIGYDCEDNPIPNVVLDSTDVEIIGSLDVEIKFDSFFNSRF